MFLDRINRINGIDGICFWFYGFLPSAHHVEIATKLEPHGRRGQGLLE